MPSGRHTRSPCFPGDLLVAMSSRQLQEIACVMHVQHARHPRPSDRDHPNELCEGSRASYARESEAAERARVGRPECMATYRSPESMSTYKVAMPSGRHTRSPCFPGDLLGRHVFPASYKRLHVSCTSQHARHPRPSDRDHPNELCEGSRASYARESEGSRASKGRGRLDGGMWDSPGNGIHIPPFGLAGNVIHANAIYVPDSLSFNKFSSALFPPARSRASLSYRQPLDDDGAAVSVRLWGVYLSDKKPLAEDGDGFFDGAERAGSVDVGA
ncbi:hypothetical protein F3Y22_tig00111005pilonHSYRG00212 [Hibiscus syriacus]|uniref:Uncharacterized protein n=1 Tax=Hibiscus syriacus TaxID=106335 RepID=A0A6A2ZAB9_HIBSY|nr:hypothetical protein F3Y22_tig00111005pilonHSYRG00212 [Hibiscus syriacus]